MIEQILYGIIQVVLGAVLLMIYGHALFHLMFALVGFYLLYKGLTQVLGKAPSTPLSAHIMYWRSRFFR